LIPPRAKQPRVCNPGQAAIPLVVDLLCRGNLVRLRVTGRSMLPWLEDGAVVTLRKVPAEAVEPGNIVLFHTAEGRPLLHRVISSRRDTDGAIQFLVKGDARALPDGFLPGSSIVGKVVTVTRKTSHGTCRAVSLESPFRGAVHRALALLSHRSPRLFCALSTRLVPPWRRVRTCFSR